MPLIVTLASFGTQTVRFPVSAAVGSAEVRLGTGGMRPPSGTTGVVVPGIPTGFSAGVTGAGAVDGIMGVNSGLTGAAAAGDGAIAGAGAGAGVGTEVPSTCVAVGATVGAVTAPQPQELASDVPQ